MKTFWRVMAGFVLFSLMAEVNAWNFTGHVVIAQIAYDNLTPEKKAKADRLANLIYNELPVAEQVKLDAKYSNASTFAKLALLPDVWRKWKLETLFRKFDANIPLNLLLSSQQPTAGWHFIDQPYPQPSPCNTVEPNNIVWALQKLETDISRTNDPQTKALMMVLTEHYMGDIHQPLHTMTNVSKNCAGDRGGNNFCLKYGKNGQCSKNLHSLWDSGIGFLKPNKSIQQLAYEIEQDFPKGQFSQQLNNHSLVEWSNEIYKKAPIIYNVVEYNTPTPVYYREMQLIAKSQVALAGYQLASIFNNLL